MSFVLQNRIKLALIWNTRNNVYSMHLIYIQEVMLKSFLLSDKFLIAFN